MKKIIATRTGKSIWNARFSDVELRKKPIIRRRKSCLFGMHRYFLILINGETMRICKKCGKVMYFNIHAFLGRNVGYIDLSDIVAHFVMEKLSGKNVYGSEVLATVITQYGWGLIKTKTKC